jgi:hypothetical protein
MNINEEIKRKIIENEIIAEQDLLSANEDQISFAAFIVHFLENDTEYSNKDSMTEHEQNQFMEQFANEFYEIQDRLQLEECDKVKSEKDKERDFESLFMKIPINFAKFVREEIFPKMK